MKTRIGFVSNSSSSSFIITNTSNTAKLLKDFVKEAYYIGISQFMQYYPEYKDDSRYSLTSLVKEAEEIDILFLPNGEEICSFCSDMGSPLGWIFRCYIGSSGKTENFEWRYLHEG